MSPVATLDKLKINYRNTRPFFTCSFSALILCFMAPVTRPHHHYLAWMPVTWTSHPRPQIVSKIYGIRSSQKQLIIGFSLKDMLADSLTKPLPRDSHADPVSPLTPYISAD